MIAQLKHNINRFLFQKKTTDTPSEAAYDLWAADYDHQPDNLMLALDEHVFTVLLNGITVKDKTVADMGCGTGRHWPKLLAKEPAMLTGYDVSGGMLDELKKKYPQAKAVKLEGDLIPVIPAQSLDVIISTLTIAHIADVDSTIKAWANALKPDACVIMTDFHPEALAMGGKRTFSHQDKQVSITNYVHQVNTLIQKFAAYGFIVTALEERLVDEAVKPYYEKKNALSVYEKFKGRPIIYGMCLTRSDYAAQQPASN